MQYKCEVCHDSGSKNQTGDYLDCPACDMPHTRKALNDFVKSLGPTHPEDVALAIHQRSLAMAPKQEAPEPAPEIRTVLRDALASGLTMAYGCSRVWSAWGVGTMSQDDFYPASECDDLLDELCDLAIAALRPDHAAPAAANGAPELPAPATLIVESDIGHRAYTADQMRAYGQACAAAGPDAALVELNDEQVHQGVMALLGCTSSEVEDYSAKLYEGYANDVRRVHAALSGAKGN